MKNKFATKEVWLSVALLILLVILAIANTVLTNRWIEELVADVESLSIESSSKDSIERIEKAFDRLDLFLSITLNQNEIDEAKDDLTEFITAIEIEDEAAAKIAKSRLVDALRRLGRLSSVRIDSII